MTLQEFKLKIKDDIDEYLIDDIIIFFKYHIFI